MPPPGFADFEHSFRRPIPQLLPVPDAVRGFRIRVDLLHTKPPVWRRIDVAGDLTLDRLHDVLQTSMGWTDSHLHTFYTSNDRNPPAFLTWFDVEEGDEGLLENDARLDQVVSAVGDRLWYDYDFGDGWEHLLRVEKVLDEPPVAPVCIAGKLACPPEDCGGTGGYEELADWVRSDYDVALLPGIFVDQRDAHAWLPEGWHPDDFDIEHTNELLALVGANPIPVVDELAELLEFATRRGATELRSALAHPASHGPTEVDVEAAATAVEPFRVLLDVIGEGADLTAAGYLKPAMVTQIARRTGVMEWWLGPANREDRTAPVANLRTAARELGLVSVRKGRIASTKAAMRLADDPVALLRHITARLPLGKAQHDRHAGWATLAVVGSDEPTEAWRDDISLLLFDLGWRYGNDPLALPPARNPTLRALELLAGSTHHWNLAPGVNATVAAVARSAMRGR